MRRDRCAETTIHSDVSDRDNCEEMSRALRDSPQHDIHRTSDFDAPRVSANHFAPPKFWHHESHRTTSGSVVLLPCEHHVTPRTIRISPPPTSTHRGVQRTTSHHQSSGTRISPHDQRFRLRPRRTAEVQRTTSHYQSSGTTSVTARLTVPHCRRSRQQLVDDEVMPPLDRGDVRSADEFKQTSRGVGLR